MSSPPANNEPWTTAPLVVFVDVLLVLIVLAGIAVRGIGLPLHIADSGDEWGNMIAPLRLLYEHGDPNVFLHPALYYYVTAAAYVVVYTASKVVGAFGVLASMTDLFVQEPRVFVYAARAVSVVFAASAIWALYAFGRSLWRRPQGVMAAALLAVLPLHVFYSKTVRVDSLFLFVFLCAFWSIVRILERPSSRTYAVAGLLSGLAIGANYNGAILIPWLIAAHVLRNRHGAALPVTHDLLRALLLVAVGFVLTNPFTVLNFDTFARNFAHQAGLLLAAHPGWEERDPFYYVTSIARTHPPLLALIGISSLAILVVGNRTERFVLSLPIVYTAFFELMQTRDDRFILPAMALFLLVAGGMPFVLCRRFASIPFLRVASVVVSYSLLFVCLANLATESFQIPQPLAHEVLKRPDGVLLDWIDAHARPHSAILVESGVVSLIDTLKEPGRFAAELRASVAAKRPNLDQRYIGAVFVGGRNYDPSAVARKEIDYAIVAPRNVSYIEGRCQQYPEVCAFYAELRRAARVVFETPPGFEPAVVYEVK